VNRLEHTTGSHQLGTLPGSAVSRDYAVPPIWSDDQNKGGDKARSSHWTVRGTGAALSIHAADRNTSTSAPRCTTASSAPWRRAVAGRNAADSESAHRLGASSDRHSRSSCEGCGESSHSIRPTRTFGARSEASRVSRPERVRVRIASWRVRGQLQDGLGVVTPDRQRARDEARETRCARRSRQTAADRPALARPPSSCRARHNRHEGTCRLVSDGVDIRTIQLMLGHTDIKQTQRYLNITDEELRKAMTGVWERRRQLRAVGQ
jgi:hypothetical protein